MTAKLKSRAVLAVWWTLGPSCCLAIPLGSVPRPYTRPPIGHLAAVLVVSSAAQHRGACAQVTLSFLHNGPKAQERRCEHPTPQRRQKGLP